MPWGYTSTIIAQDALTITAEVFGKEYHATLVGDYLVWNNGDLWEQGEAPFLEASKIFSDWGASGEVVNVGLPDCVGSACSRACANVSTSVEATCSRSLGVNGIRAISSISEPGGSSAADPTFSFGVDAGQVCATRTDSSSGWSGSLQVLCELPPDVDFASVGPGLCRTREWSAGTMGTVTLESIEECRSYCVEMAFCVAYEFSYGNLCEIHFEDIVYTTGEPADAYCFKKYRMPNYHRWDENVNPSGTEIGGVCKCPDGQRYEVGAIGGDCGSLACEGGEAGECGPNVTKSLFTDYKVTCNMGVGPAPPFSTWQLGTAGHDAAYALAMGTDGSAVIAGTMHHHAVFEDRSKLTDKDASDVVVIKYGRTGKRLWTLQHGSGARDQARGVAVDTSGNSFVVGCVQGALDGETHEGGKDIFVMKLSPDGETQWTVQTGSSGDDCALAVQLDASGDAYVVGHRSGSGDGNAADLYLMKVTSDGNFFPLVQKGTSYNEWSTALAIDAAGNLLVAGFIEDLDGVGFHGDLDWFSSVAERDVFLLKLDAGGNRIWSFHRTGEGTTEQGAFAMALDASGSAIMAGYADNALDGEPHAGGWDVMVMKVSSEGEWLWTVLRGSEFQDGANAVTVDAGGDIYVAGFTAGALDEQIHYGGYDIFLMKFDADGRWEWTIQRGTGGDDEAMAVAIGPASDVFLSGYTNGAMAEAKTWIGASDLFLLRKNGDWCPRGEVESVSFIVKADSGSCTGYENYDRSGVLASESEIAPDLSIDRPTCEGLALAGIFTEEDPQCSGFCLDMHTLRFDVSVLYMVNLMDVVLCMVSLSLCVALLSYKLLFGNFSFKVNIGLHIIIAVLVGFDGVLQLASLVISIKTLPAVKAIHNAWCIDPTHPNGMGQFSTLVKLEESLSFVLVVGIFELLMGAAAGAADAKLILNLRVDPLIPVEAIADSQAGQEAEVNQGNGRAEDVQEYEVTIPSFTPEPPSNGQGETGVAPHSSEDTTAALRRDDEMMKQIRDHWEGVKTTRATVARMTLWGVFTADLLDAAASILDFCLFTSTAKTESDHFFDSITSDPYSWCLWPEVIRSASSCDQVPMSASHRMVVPSFGLLAIVLAIVVGSFAAQR